MKAQLKKVWSRRTWLVPAFAWALAVGTVQAGGDTLYVDSYYGATSKKNAKYIIVREDVRKHKKHWTWNESVYCANGSLHSTYPVQCTEAGHPERHGLYKEFYSNGNVKKGALYEMGEQVGEFTEYYPDGKIKIKGNIQDANSTYVYNILDTAGNDQLDHGNGLVVEYDSAWGNIRYYEVRDSLRGHTFYIDSLSQDTVYTELEKELGLRIRTIIISGLPYNIAKKYAGQKLYVNCLVDEQGRITRTQNRNSIQPQLDTIMIEKIKYVKGFSPPTLRNGKRVKTAVVIPLAI